MQNSSLKKDLEQVVNLFPKLLISQDMKILEGEIDIFDNDESYVDSFLIQIHIPKNYPYGMPILFEKSEKICHIADRHFNEDESCCVAPLQEADLLVQRGITIMAYMESYAIPFLANQIYFENEKKWANGEYAHGIAGILQYYTEILKIENIDEVLLILIDLSQKKYSRNENCFCGSKVKQKRCHYESYKIIKNLSAKRLNEDVVLLKALSESKKST